VVVFFSLPALNDVMLPSNACLPSCGGAWLLGGCWVATGGGGAGITGGGGGGIPQQNTNLSFFFEVTP